jgi:hypothetical protein
MKTAVSAIIISITDIYMFSVYLILCLQHIIILISIIITIIFKAAISLQELEYKRLMTTILD